MASDPKNIEGLQKSLMEKRYKDIYRELVDQIKANVKRDDGKKLRSEDIARAIGMTRENFSRLTGGKSNVSAEHITKLIELFGKTIIEKGIKIENLHIYHDLTWGLVKKDSWQPDEMEPTFVSETAPENFAFAERVEDVHQGNFLRNVFLKMALSLEGVAERLGISMKTLNSYLKKPKLDSYISLLVYDEFNIEIESEIAKAILGNEGEISLHELLFQLIESIKHFIRKSDGSIIDDEDIRKALNLSSLEYIALKSTPEAVEQFHIYRLWDMFKYEILKENIKIPNFLFSEEHIHFKGEKRPSFENVSNSFEVEKQKRDRVRDSAIYLIPFFNYEDFDRVKENNGFLPILDTVKRRPALPDMYIENPDEFAYFRIPRTLKNPHYRYTDLLFCQKIDLSRAWKSDFSRVLVTTRTKKVVIGDIVKLDPFKYVVLSPLKHVEPIGIMTENVGEIWRIIAVVHLSNYHLDYDIDKIKKMNFDFI